MESFILVGLIYSRKHIYMKMRWKLSDRTFVCKDCGLEIDRDLNAAINIQAVGVDAAIRTQSSQVASCVEASKME